MTATFTSREFNQDVSRAKRDAKAGPVFITDRGQPSHVLLSYGDYKRMTERRPNIVEALSMQGLSDIAFEPPKVGVTAKPADLS